MKKLYLALAALSLMSLIGCYCTSQEEVLTIPRRCNVDSVSLKDGHLDATYHKRTEYEKPNCPMTLPLYIIEEDAR